MAPWPLVLEKEKVDDEAAQLAADAEEDVDKLVEKHKRGEVEGNEEDDYEEDDEDDYEEQDSGDDYAGGDDDEEEDFEVEEEEEDDYDDKPKKGTFYLPQHALIHQKK